MGILEAIELLFSSFVIMNLDAELDLGAFSLFTIIQLLIALLLGWLSCTRASYSNDQVDPSKERSIYSKGEYVPKSKNCPENYCIVIVDSNNGDTKKQVVRETYYTFLGVESCLDYCDEKCVRVTGLSFSNVIFFAFGLTGLIVIYLSNLLNSLLELTIEQTESYGWALIFSALLCMAIRMMVGVIHIKSGLKEYTAK